MRTWSGTLAVLDTWTADGRRIGTPPTDLWHRELPMPLVMRNPPGSSNVPEPVGTIDTLTLLPADELHDYRAGDGPRVAYGLASDTDRIDPPSHPPRVWATGRISPALVRDVDPQYADRLEAGEPCGIGVDLDQTVAVMIEPEPATPDVLAALFHAPVPLASSAYVITRQHISDWRIMCAHLHDQPAWPECVITLDAP